MAFLAIVPETCTALGLCPALTIHTILAMFLLLLLRYSTKVGQHASTMVAMAYFAWYYHIGTIALPAVPFASLVMAMATKKIGSRLLPIPHLQ